MRAGNAGFSFARVLLPALGLVLAFPAAAATEDETPRFEARVAGGPALVPDYDGSSDFEFVPYFEANVYYGPYSLALAGPRARVNVVPHSLINAGPVVSFQRGRDNVSNAQVDRLPRIDPAFELGAFIEFEHRHAGDSMSAERLRLMVRQDVTGNHGGTVATLRGVFQRHVVPGTVVAVSADATWASRDFMDTFFSVTQRGAARSGLQPFQAGSGIRNVGVSLSLDQFLSPTWSVGARVYYSRLLNDAADSPVTATAGSADQLFGAAVVGYRF